jgi:hypothetical protein
MTSDQHECKELGSRYSQIGMTGEICPADPHRARSAPVETRDMARILLIIKLVPADNWRFRRTPAALLAATARSVASAPNFL